MAPVPRPGVRGSSGREESPRASTATRKCIGLSIPSRSPTWGGGRLSNPGSATNRGHGSKTLELSFVQLDP